MDFSSLGTIGFTWEFVGAFLSIVLIDLILAGDNAVVIAMAVRSLSPKERLRGIIIGSGGAVVLRVILTFFAAKLLAIGGIKFLGGLLIMWIAIKLFLEGVPEDKFRKQAKTLGQAVITIMIADLVMSTDNVLAVAGASKGNLALLLFGLGLSIPFVVFTSNLLSKLMDRFPFIIYIGAAILGKVAGEMMLTDPYVQRFFHAGRFMEYTVQAAFAGAVLAIGAALLRLRAARARAAERMDQVDIIGVFSR
jgi:YjbE family integral membrane protein